MCSDVYICSTWQIIISTCCEWPQHVRVIIAIILVSAVIVVIVIVIIIIIICCCIIIVIKKIYFTCHSGKLLLRFISLKQLCRPTKPPFPWQMLPACQITFWLLLKHASPKGCSTGLRLSDSILFSVILCVLLKACLFVFIVLRQKNFHNMVSYPFPLSRCCVKHVISPDFF